MDGMADQNGEATGSGEFVGCSKRGIIPGKLHIQPFCLVPHFALTETSDLNKLPDNLISLPFGVC